jgi:hypothetical protein
MEAQAISVLKQLIFQHDELLALQGSMQTS